MGQLWADTMEALNSPNAFSGPFLFCLYGIIIVGGIVAVWMYAAVRPRFGAAVRTLVYAGMATWSFRPCAGHDIHSRRRLRPAPDAYSSLFVIVEAVVGTIVGPARYKEAESTADYPAAAAARQTRR